MQDNFFAVFVFNTNGVDKVRREVIKRVLNFILNYAIAVYSFTIFNSDLSLM
jgi:hypothetical protein